MRWLLFVALSLAQCSTKTAPAPMVSAAIGDATRGRALLEKLECNRCHTISAIDAPAHEKQCTGCHDEILRGSVKGTPAQISRWRTHVAELADVPSLESTGSRFQRAWLRSFLLAPHDLRPALVPTMPRLPLTEQDALDLATYLSPLDPETRDPLAGGDVARGHELVENAGCVACHRFTGASVSGVILPTTLAIPDLPRAVRLAPDLRFVRDRFRASALAQWLERPRAMKPDTLMPDYGFTRDQARDIAAFLMKSRLAPVALKELPARLPILERVVRWDEVAEKVFKKTCWHCHGEPDFELGDGGPGNSGGFGFEGKGINLSSYASTFSGFLDDKRERTSLFIKTKDGAPYIVAALLARQREEAGERPDMRGMPLGLPALSPVEIQLVETWIAKGRLR